MRDDSRNGAGCGEAKNGYSRDVRKEDLIAYANRDWAGNERRKREFMAQQACAMTVTERLAVGDELRRYAQMLHPEWPTAEDRAADLAVHLRVSESLRSVIRTGRR